METLKPTPTEEAPREKENFIIPENKDRSSEFTYPEPDWKKEEWSVEGAFEEPAQSDAAAAREAAQIREITAGLGEAPKEYKGGVIAERLSGGYEGSTEPLTSAQLEHFYEQSTSPVLETQQDLSENLRGLSQAQMAQWVEHLAARKPAVRAETTKKERWNITGNLYDDTSPNSESSPEKALSHEQMELIHNLGSAGLEASGSTFKEQLDSLKPAQTEQLMDYLLSREDDTAESARIIHRMSPEQQDVYFNKRNVRNNEKVQGLSAEAEAQAQAETVTLEPKTTGEAPQATSIEANPLALEGELSPEQLERIHALGVSDSKEEFGRQVDALTPEQNDQLMSYRAKRMLNGQAYFAPLSPEQMDNLIAAGNSSDEKERAQYQQALSTMPPEQVDTLNRRRAATITAKPDYIGTTPPKRRWWNIFGRRGRKNNS